MKRFIGILLFTAVFAAAYPHPEGYYKHLFMDGGINLTSRAYFPGGNALADTLKYNFEYVATTSLERTVRVLAGNPADSLNSAYAPDDNGYLLYPDGAPRYTMVYVNGGTSSNHGNSLGEKGRQRFRDFFYNGGSYIGTCAGAFIAGLDNCPSLTCAPEPAYFHFWPGYLAYTSIGRSANSCYPGMDIEDLDPVASGVQNPLLNYHSFGGDNNVDWVRHHGGPYFPTAQTFPAGTEILGRYDTVGSIDHGRVSLIAYKRDSLTGRALLNGCHPEGDSSGMYPFATGERYELFSAKIRYASEGMGVPRIKGTLKNNVPRTMADNLIPGHEKIGDYQYHHFKVQVPASSPFLKVAVAGTTGFPINVYAKQGGVAFNSLVPAGQKEVSNTNSKTLLINLPSGGDWNIGVELDTAVVCSQAYHPVYKGPLAVLNGIAYSVTASYNDQIPPSHTLQAVATSHGTISPSGTVAVPEGGDQFFFIRPDSGYDIDYLTVDGVDVGAGPTYAFTDVRGDRTISAYFKEHVFQDTMIVDNNLAGTDSTGAWGPSSAINSYGTASLYTGSNKLPVGTYTWQASLFAASTYSVEMWWTSIGSRMRHIPVVIYDGDAVLDTIYVNQQANGGKWNLLLPPIRFTSGTARVTILHIGAADSTVCADAIRIIGNPRTISGGTKGEDQRADLNGAPLSLSVGPNPFNPAARIRFALPKTGPVELMVYNVQGARVATLSAGKTLAAGSHVLTWHGTDDRGRGLASGMYVFQLRYGSRIKTDRAMLVK